MRVFDQKAAMLIRSEMKNCRVHRGAGDYGAAWHALERAHVIAQPFLNQHLTSRGTMLGFALRPHDWRETAGQLLRLALVPLGAFTGRLPIGYTGRARVSAFRPMPMPADLAERRSAGDKPVRT